MNLRDSDQLRPVLAAICVIALGLSATVVGVVFYDSDRVEYHKYEIKSQQVQTDSGYSGNATQFTDLSPEVQDALIDSYKKSDHFLGDGASVTVRTDSKLNEKYTDTLSVVEVEGVKLLITIDHSGTYSELQLIHMASIFAIVFGGGTTVIGVFFLRSLYNEKRS